MTANFLLLNLFAMDSMGCLKGLPAMSNATFLLKELLYCLLQHFVPIRGGFRVTFYLGRDNDQYLQALIMRLLILATNYRNVVSWCVEINLTDGLMK